MPSTLCLVRDYSRFIITFFDVISLSAPHIYHSALPLSPQTSIIRKLYKQYTRPLARVVRGLPSSWDQTAATLYWETTLCDAIWSPCNRVIAIVDPRSVVTLDAATLSQLDAFKIPSQYLDNDHWRLSFSPDGHFLTLIGGGELISWDLQTGGPLGAIPSGLDKEESVALSSTYSEDGKVVAAAYSDPIDNTCICTYDLSGTEAGRHYAPEGQIIPPIWTHGKCIRFVTIDPGSVTISEVEFTLKNPPVEVESLPIPDSTLAIGERFLFLPSLFRLAFDYTGMIQVWDVKAAKLLLNSESGLPKSIFGFDLLTPVSAGPIGSFSSDGRFFAHVDRNGAACVWKESHAGYVLHQKLPFATSKFPVQPRLSPSGKSIFMSPDHGASHLWHTRDPVPSLPSISENDFVLVFSPDERCAAFARRRGKVVIIFNPLTGDSQAIDTDMGIVCLGMTGSALIVVGKRKIITWDLPGDDYTFNTSINDSVRTTKLHRDRGTPVRGSISPDFSRIAVLSAPRMFYDLKIYDISTGRCLTSTRTFNSGWVGFTWDGREVWVAQEHSKKRWNIVEDSGSGPIRLERRDEIGRPSEGFPWESRRGYEVTGDGWVLSATQKRLLWLPHRWRSEAWGRVWSGRFLGLLHKELSEVIILEFPE